MPIITQHARVNQKWFYLPADETIGFSEKMGVDFLTPIRLPRIALERLIEFRKARLKEIAKQHFRERLAGFFRRYAYDEWYPLTREELAKYQKTYPFAEPFAWQKEARYTQEISPVQSIEDKMPPTEYKKEILDYLSDGEAAIENLTSLLSTIATETSKISEKITNHTANLNTLNQRQSKAGKIKKVVLLAASDMTLFSGRIKNLLPEFETLVNDLNENYSGYIRIAKEANRAEDISNFRVAISGLLEVTAESKKSVGYFRDESTNLAKLRLNGQFSQAATNQSEVLTEVVSKIEDVESFALSMLHLIEEDFLK